ncbi:hypothetical protein [Ferruginibacter sp.]|nr:hypothetical protein [Ferruginibacter sp.]
MGEEEWLPSKRLIIVNGSLVKGERELCVFIVSVLQVTQICGTEILLQVAGVKG